MNIFRKLLPYLIGLYIILNILFSNTAKIGDFKITSDMLLLFFILIFLISNIFNFKNLLFNIIDFLKDPLSISMIATLIIMSLSITYSFDKTVAISETARFLSYIIIYFIVKYEISNINVVKALIKVFLITLFVGNTISLLQVFTGIGMNHSFNIVSSGVSYYRIPYTFGNPNSFGAFLVICIFPVLIIFLRENKLFKKSVYGVLLILTITNIYLTASKNAWLAIVIGCIVLSAAYNIKFLLGVLIQAIFALLIPPIRIRLLNLSASVFGDGRLKLWGLSLQMIKEHPFFGVGNGNYVPLHDIYATKYPEYYDHGLTGLPTHNSYLKIQCEIGTLGTIAFTSVLICSIKKLKTIYSKAHDEFIRDFYLGFYVSFITFLFMNLFDNFFFVPKVVVYIWIFLAMADGILKNENIFNRG